MEASRLRGLLAKHMFDLHDEVGLGVAPDRKEEAEIRARVQTLAQTLAAATAEEDAVCS